MLRRVRPVFEIVYESRGKLIGGSLSRERKANSRPSENEGGDNHIFKLVHIVIKIPGTFIISYPHTVKCTFDHHDNITAHTLLKGGLGTTTEQIRRHQKQSGISHVLFDSISTFPLPQLVKRRARTLALSHVPIMALLAQSVVGSCGATHGTSWHQFQSSSTQSERLTTAVCRSKYQCNVIE